MAAPWASVKARVWIASQPNRLSSTAPAWLYGAIKPPFLTTSRTFKMPSQAAMRRDQSKAERQAAKKGPMLSKLNDDAGRAQWAGGSNLLIPGMFVPLPLSQYPRHPRAFLQYTRHRLTTWLSSTLEYMNLKFRCKERFWKRSHWTTRRRQLGPTAKAMHRTMLEAFAAGDKATLQRTCTRHLALQLTAAIDRRNPREQTNFELIKYNNPIFNPSLRAHYTMQGLHPDKNVVLEQAIVAISSTQQAFRSDAITGKIIPGSSRTQDKTEYVVLSRLGNAVTWEIEPWRVWGTTSTTSLESWQKFVKVAEAESEAGVSFKSKEKLSQ